MTPFAFYLNCGVAVVNLGCVFIRGPVWRQLMSLILAIINIGCALALRAVM